MIFLFVGSIFFLIGVVFFLLPSKKPNFIYGYRSYQAEKSLESWRYAQKISARYFLLFGGGTALVGGLLKYSGHTNFFILEMILIVLPVILPFALTEEKLKTYNQKIGVAEDEYFDD